MTLLTIAFLPASDNGLSFRGSEIALYDYASYIETLFNHKSIICLGKNAYNEPLVLEKFKKRFNTFVYFDNKNDLEKQLLELNVDGLYAIRYGNKQEPLLDKIKMLIHCVYVIDNPGGFVNAAVSESVAKSFGSELYVPHMVSLYDTMEDYRKILNIPQDAIVFGRHGGMDTFDLNMAKNVILRTLNEKNNIYFLFAIRPYILKDISHPRLICLEVFVDPKIKRKFINTCDAMIHAQSLGETQGLSVLEFSCANKPVITWNGGRCKQHLINLDDKAIKYNNEDELYNILSNFDKDNMKYKYWDVTAKYKPEIIMSQFDKIFLQPLM